MRDGLVPGLTQETAPYCTCPVLPQPFMGQSLDVQDTWDDPGRVTDYIAWMLESALRPELELF